MYFNININDLSFLRNSSVLSIYAGDDENSLEEVVSLPNQVNKSMAFRRLYQIESKKIVRIIFVTRNIYRPEYALRGFNLDISIEDHTHRDQYKTVGIVLAFPVCCFILCCLYGCIRNKCAEVQRRRRSRRPRPRMTMRPSDFPEQEQLTGAGDNIYTIDNSLATRLPLPKLPRLSVCENLNEKLYETISLRSLCIEDVEKSGVESEGSLSLSTPVLTDAQRKHITDPDYEEVRAPRYFSLEAEIENKK